jgi:hypothetical protein
VVLFIFRKKKNYMTTEVELPKEISYFLFNNQSGMIVKPKSSSKLMRAIGWLFSVTKISPQFMERYYTTIGRTVYVPDNLLINPDVKNLIRVLTHESIHIMDSDRLSDPLFKILYLFPQSLASLALLSLLAPLSIKFLWCLLFLLCLAPIPAPFRYWFELRAYRTSILFARKEDNLKDEEMLPIYEWITKQLSTNLYYFTWPFPSMIMRNLKDESFLGEKEYEDIIKDISIKKTLDSLRSQ